MVCPRVVPLPPGAMVCPRVVPLPLVGVNAVYYVQHVSVDHSQSVSTVLVSTGDSGRFRRPYQGLSPRLALLDVTNFLRVGPEHYAIPYHLVGVGEPTFFGRHFQSCQKFFNTVRPLAFIVELVSSKYWIKFWSNI